MEEMYVDSEPKYGIITALAIEYLAMKAVIDSSEEKVINGLGKCLIGTINSQESGIHHLVVAQADMGNNMSALCAEKLRSEFPSIDTFIMVGIAGAVPNQEKPEEHVRLGDIVVVGKEGIAQYDFIKKAEDNITYKYPPRPPKASLLKAAEVLKREEEEGKFPWNDYIASAINLRGEDWKRPPEELDILEYPKGNIIIHPENSKRMKGKPLVFIGVIASGNTLLKDPIMRDNIGKRLSAKAVEMEASGVADASWINEATYFAVRGMCDYCDGNKNDIWQKYASITAAAYTKALFVSIPGAVLSKEKQVPVPSSANTIKKPLLDIQFTDISNSQSIGRETTLEYEVLAPINKSKFTEHTTLSEMGITEEANHNNKMMMQLQIHETDYGSTWKNYLVEIIKEEKKIKALPLGKAFAKSIYQFDNQNYFDDMINFLIEYDRLFPLGFSVKNNNSIAVKNLKIELVVKKDNIISLYDNNSFPEHPERTCLRALMKDKQHRQLDINVIELRECCNIQARFDLIRPQETVYTKNEFYISSSETITLEMVLHVYGENIESIEDTFKIEFLTTKRDITTNDMIRIEDEYNH